MFDRIVSIGSGSFKDCRKASGRGRGDGSGGCFGVEDGVNILYSRGLGCGSGDGDADGNGNGYGGGSSEIVKLPPF